MTPFLVDMLPNPTWISIGAFSTPIFDMFWLYTQISSMPHPLCYMFLKNTESTGDVWVNIYFTSQRIPEQWSIIAGNLLHWFRNRHERTGWTSLFPFWKYRQWVQLSDRTEDTRKMAILTNTTTANNPDRQTKNVGNYCVQTPRPNSAI